MPWIGPKRIEIWIWNCQCLEAYVSKQKMLKLAKKLAKKFAENLTRKVKVGKNRTFSDHSEVKKSLSECLGWLARAWAWLASAWKLGKCIGKCLGCFWSLQKGKNESENGENGQKWDLFQALWGLKMVQKHSSTHSKWWGMDQGGSRPMFETEKVEIKKIWRSQKVGSRKKFD